MIHYSDDGQQALHRSTDTVIAKASSIHHRCICMRTRVRVRVFAYACAYAYAYVHTWSTNTCSTPAAHLNEVCDFCETPAAHLNQSLIFCRTPAAHWNQFNSFWNALNPIKSKFVGAPTNFLIQSVSKNKSFRMAKYVILKMILNGKSCCRCPAEN